MNEYTVYRLEEWSDETWQEIIDAIEDVVVSLG